MVIGWTSLIWWTCCVRLEMRDIADMKNNFNNGHLLDIFSMTMLIMVYTNYAMEDKSTIGDKGDNGTNDSSGTNH